jgi:hypothetical protein
MMKRRRVLHRAQRGEAKLELPTIMDRGLAAKHGALYVHLAAFAIDIDRVFAAIAPDDEDDIGLTGAPDPEEQPFGWEVFLTSARVRALDPGDPKVLAMLEETCAFVLDQAPDEQGYGSQLVFGVYDAVKRGALPQSLADLFRSWRARPKQLDRALDALWKNDAAALPAIAARCESIALEPPLAPPTRATLQQMAAGQWRVR